MMLKLGDQVLFRHFLQKKRPGKYDESSGRQKA